ncbi:Piso0_005705 [Millerozyma farinosa CBS 7064]|uniref:tRNA-splicing endonuclease subunit Sen2 n=1 Tax=Pichia sorbitophila (strain ATCC MYA-4447 / BCRC 22081 / CBS 7064 / NBRC 10061 / NRRL Y-12695) TaxID=559304 RepID=G8Y2P7_PICSO|nr:Piso0_005705 [Millerozyma farinosa CBS 7064]
MGKRNRIENELKHKNPLPFVISTDYHGSVPELYPHNPVSWAYFLYKYIRLHAKPVPQSILPLPQVAFKDGMFFVEDEDDMHRLFNEGFFGKGHLSRSEPTWNSIQQQKLLSSQGQAPMSIEEITRARREERDKFKELRTRFQALELKERQGALTVDDSSEKEALRLKLDEFKSRDSRIKSGPSKETEHQGIDEQTSKALGASSREYLQLQATEVFFLRYALHAVDIDMTLLELLKECACVGSVASIGPRNNFVLEYVVYHHYRSLGWCVRSGIKFGSNFLLYKRGLPFSHAEHAIYIVPEQVSWPSISALSRVVSGVKKNLVLVFVETPRQEVFDDLLHTLEREGKDHYKKNLSNIFQQYRVNELIYRRWIAGRNRD